MALFSIITSHPLVSKKCIVSLTYTYAKYMYSISHLKDIVEGIRHII